MSNIVIKSLSKDLNNLSDFSDLHSKISNDPKITVPFDGINTYQDQIQFIFYSNLDNSSLTELNSLISSYIPPLIVGKLTLSITPKKTTSYNSNNYINISSFQITSSMALTNVTVNCYMNPGGANYTLRLFDVYNNKTLASIILSNTQSQINDMGKLSFLPTTNTLLELQAIVGNNTVANFESILVYYN